MALPAGEYTVQVTAKDADGTAVAASPLLSGVVTVMAISGIFVNGQWSQDGAWQPGGWTFSCPSGVVSKCVRSWGYKPWKALHAPAHGDVDLQPHCYATGIGDEARGFVCPLGDQVGGDDDRAFFREELADGPARTAPRFSFDSGALLLDPSPAGV